tara:strand:+ start:448 stop:675 length:228 start_codon:yes stop_codon:yes gene_type:complete
MKTLLMFKAEYTTKRFNENQKVWIVEDYGNFCKVYYKYRGKGRYVSGILKKENKTFAIPKYIEVTEDFYNRVMNK